MGFSYILQAILAGFVAGLVVSLIRGYGARWVAVATLVSGFAGMMVLGMAMYVVFSIPALIGTLVDAAPGSATEWIMIVCAVAVTVIGGSVTALAVGAMRR